MNLLDPTTQKALRLAQLKMGIPDVFDYKTLLYVGVNRMRNQLVFEFLKSHYIIDVVEVFKPNYEAILNEINPYRDVYNCNILDFKSGKKYDVVMFWHGPEHIEKSKLKGLIVQMLKYTEKMLIFGCPNGRYEQGAEYGNPFENHISHYTAEDLQKLGLQTDVIGELNEKGSNILSWKRLK
jgi:hypothetical protein